jgi:hypothetical protein
MRVRWLRTVRSIEATDGSHGALRLPYFFGGGDAEIVDAADEPVARFDGYDGPGESWYLVEIASQTEPAFRAVSLLAPMILHGRTAAIDRHLGG